MRYLLACLAGSGRVGSCLLGVIRLITVSQVTCLSPPLSSGRGQCGAIDAEPPQRTRRLAGRPLAREGREGGRRTLRLGLPLTATRTASPEPRTDSLPALPCSAPSFLVRRRCRLALFSARHSPTPSATHHGRAGLGWAACRVHGSGGLVLSRHLCHLCPVMRDDAARAGKHGTGRGRGHLARTSFLGCPTNHTSLVWVPVPGLEAARASHPASLPGTEDQVRHPPASRTAPHTGSHRPRLALSVRSTALRRPQH